MPTPESTTWTFSNSFIASYHATISIWPFSVNFKAFFIRLIKIYLSLIWSPSRTVGKSHSSVICGYKSLSFSEASTELLATLMESLLSLSLICGSNIVEMNLKVSLGLKRSSFGKNNPSSINYMSSVSLTKLISKLVIWIIIISMSRACWDSVVSWMRLSKNMREEERGALNSCDKISCEFTIFSCYCL